MPFAREDLDSNFVSMGEEAIVDVQEGAGAPDIDCCQSKSRSSL